MANALCWQAGLILWATGAAAQDCAADAFQRAVCALPEAKAAWAQMEADLAAIHGPARPAILETQARWLAMMGAWDVEATRGNVPERSQSVTLDYFEEHHAWRPKDSTDAEIIKRIEARSNDFAAFPKAWAEFEALKATIPGVAVTLATGCDYAPADVMPSGFSNLFCGGTVQMRLGDRACSIMAYGYGDRINTVYAVDDIGPSGPLHRGNCDWNGMAPDCPMAAEDDPEAHWDPKVSRDVLDMRQDLQNPNSGALAQNDPETWRSLSPYPEDWFQTCLTTPDYPPSTQVRAAE